MKIPGKMLAELFRNVTKAPATIQYPFAKIETPDDFRGRIVFSSENCIGCNICVKDCPADALKISKVGEEKIFEAVFNLDECIYCAQCVHSCPKKALSVSGDFELAQTNRESLKILYPAKAKPPKENVEKPAAVNAAPA